MADHEMYAEPDGSITHVFAEGAEPTDLVSIDHIVSGVTVGRMIVSGDVAILLEFNLHGEEESAVLAVDPDTAKVLGEGILIALARDPR